MVSVAIFAALALSLLSRYGIVVGLHTGRVFQLKNSQPFKSHLARGSIGGKKTHILFSNLLEDGSTSQLELMDTSYETVIDRDVDVIKNESGIVRKVLPFSETVESISISESKELLPVSNPLLSKSFLFLNAVAIIWGTQHVVIKTALESFPSPSVLNFWRFSLSLLPFLPACVSVVVSRSIMFLYSCLW